MLRKIYNDEIDSSDATKSKRRGKTRILDEAKSKREFNLPEDEEDMIIDPVLEELTEEELLELYDDDIFTDWEHEG